MRAVIISVGSELTSGQTVDTNSAYLARRLLSLGIETLEHRTVGDDRGAIAEAMLSAAKRADVVLVTGGLGPTDDDVTRYGLADALGGRPLVLDEASLGRLEAFFARRGRRMVPANRIQAMLPAGTRAIENRRGTAAGIAAELAGARLYVMPGVPAEMRAMFDEQVAPLLGPPETFFEQRVLHAFGTGESDVGEKIRDLMQRGRNPAVGTTVSAGLISVRITARGHSPDSARELADQAAAEVRRRLGELVIGRDDETMASVVGRLLRDAGQTLATAESCTGGLLGKMITDVPGASEYYLGGVVSYANAVKLSLLGVPAGMLAEQEAVSEPVARAMAAGCRRLLAADWAVATTGIAGPGGGSETKPVGLVWIALAGPAGEQAHRHVLPGDRATVRLRAATAALNHLRLALLGRAD
ncbi:MAG: competence/damage-inducible protein A [Planctomycetes bacterium]|nr:competence/damage-inducible protein A [Planctomycetota bacterium]